MGADDVDEDFIEPDVRLDDGAVDGFVLIVEVVLEGDSSL
jgi:hypothetical protein